MGLRPVAGDAPRYVTLTFCREKAESRCSYAIARLLPHAEVSLFHEEPDNASGGRTQFLAQRACPGAVAGVAEDVLHELLRGLRRGFVQGLPLHQAQKTKGSFAAPAQSDPRLNSPLTTRLESTGVADDAR